MLLIRPAEEGTAPFLSGRPLLVPLDGTDVREQALPIATALASACGVGIKLVIVVPTLGTLSGVETASRVLLQGTTNEVLALAEEDAALYLRRHADNVQSQGIDVAADIYRGDPTDAIVTVAHKLGVDMIVMGTLGKTGMDAFWSSSVAPKVSRRTHLPLLLVPHNRQTNGEKTGKMARFGRNDVAALPQIQPFVFCCRPCASRGGFFRSVAQIFNLPYRRFSTCVLAYPTSPISNRRYGRLQTCVTVQARQSSGHCSAN